MNTKHNLSASSPGTIKDPGEGEICIFCHTPHTSQGQVPLWNHTASSAAYTPYSSTTAKALVGQPTGASKLCLGCHDGTVGIGMMRKPGRAGASSLRQQTMPAGAARLGMDLSDDHPISFTFDSALASMNGQLRDPANLTGPVRLDQNRQVQCTSCHASHDNRFGKFLVMDNYGSALCLSCHSPPNWNGSVHQTSPRSWNGTLPNPWPHTSETTVMGNGCENCHRPHSAGTPQRLLNLAREEDNCFVCHNGNVAAKNLQAEFNKTSTHNVGKVAGVHDPAEDPINPSRHVECADCHNPHAATSSAGAAPLVSGALAGVKGVSATGAILKTAANEYEVCFRCHGDSTARGAARVERQFPQTNARLEFSPGNASYHPVETTGRNSQVPSLISPWTTSSLLYCTDCHNNNSGPGAGGTGPKGPHGSIYEPLLERRLEMADHQSENSLAYALCYKCHSRTSILGNHSFPQHKKHVADAKTACTTCHDSHGVATVSHLINFNTTYVTKSSGGRLEFIDNGVYRGACYLTCHGKDHNPLSY